ELPLRKVCRVRRLPTEVAAQRRDVALPIRAHAPMARVERLRDVVVEGQRAIEERLAPRGGEAGSRRQGVERMVRALGQEEAARVVGQQPPCAGRGGDRAGAEEQEVA